MKARALAVAVFRTLASRSSSSDGSGPVSELIAEVSIGSPEGALVDRGRFESAVTLLVTSKLVEPAGESLRLTAEGDQFWRKVAHLEPAGMKKWIREAVDCYSRGGEARWEASEETWSNAQVRFLESHRTRITRRLEILDGLLAAIENWHFVSTTVGGAEDRSAAIAALQGTPLLFSKLQAQEVVEMRLSQRSVLGRLSLAEERDAIRAELQELEDPLPSEELGFFPKPEVLALEHIAPRTRVAG